MITYLLKLKLCLVTWHFFTELCPCQFHVNKLPIRSNINVSRHESKRIEVWLARRNIMIQIVTLINKKDCLSKWHKIPWYKCCRKRRKRLEVPTCCFQTCCSWPTEPPSRGREVMTAAAIKKSEIWVRKKVPWDGGGPLIECSTDRIFKKLIDLSWPTGYESEVFKVCSH